MKRMLLVLAATLPFTVTAMGAEQASPRPLQFGSIPLLEECDPSEGLQDGCEYFPESFFPDFGQESEYGPGDRDGGIPSDGFDCFDFYQWYYLTEGCG